MEVGVEAGGDEVVVFGGVQARVAEACGDGARGGHRHGPRIGVGGHDEGAERSVILGHTESMNSDTSVMVKPALRMRDLCARTGATPRMIRHYEATGILAPGRTSNGYRSFTEEDVRTVEDARCLIEAGLTAAETADLVGIVCGPAPVTPAEVSAALDRIAERRSLLDARIEELLAARRKLDELREYVEAERL
ncbi:hypothetical protein MTP03_11440 [Tsukamurella sp. PLM1]|nr:hypothetical protein MTP03_11440 [Tsukamurella sp. PLM1]